VQVTAPNTDEDIDLLLAVLDEADERFGLAGAWHGPVVAAHAG
jgi:hypothetical protein